MIFLSVFYYNQIQRGTYFILCVLCEIMNENAISLISFISTLNNKIVIN